MIQASLETGPDALTSRRYLPWLLLLFVGSGCAALIYEVVWLQLLELVIGSSGISVGVLLGTYMGGMCLGSFFLPRLTSGRTHPLKVYAFLELGIGIIGLAVLTGMPLVADLYTNFLGHGILSRALIAAVCLLPPTFLMGATLPAISRWVEATPEGVSWMGLFYGGNIAGAVFGSLFAGFYLLRLYDMPIATYTAAAINAIVCALALTLASKTSSRVTSTRGASALTEAPRLRPLVYTSIAVSGMCALGAEVVWTRLLSLMLGATVYTFSIILAAFLVGLGIGSTVGAQLSARMARPRVGLAVCQVFAVVSSAWAALIVARSLPYWPINPSLLTDAWAPWNMFQIDILSAAWVVLPAAIAWGASFPLALAAVASPGQDSGRMVGGIYAANTIGAIAGSLAFSMILIPQFGTLWAQRLLIILSGLSAIVAFVSSMAPSVSDLPRPDDIRASRIKFSMPAAAGIVVSAGCAALLALSVTQVPWMAIAWGRFAATWRSYTVPGIVPENSVPSGGGDQRYCVYVGEGLNVSVAVTKSTSGVRYFHGAGKVQASSEPQDMRLQRMLGHLSVLARRSPDEVEDVLVVACGAGVTAGSFIPYPRIKRIEICDIEPLVPKVVTPMFGEQNYHIVDGIDKQNPHQVNGKQVRVIYDDGRHYIRTLPKDARYDIITSDPIDPWVKGCAAMNTVEYYQMCKDHLKPGGVMSLWIPFYESDDETAKTVLATFFEVFPNGIVFSNDMNGGGYDAVLLGHAGDTKINLDEVQRRLDSDEYSAVRASLRDAGFGAAGSALTDLLATYAGRARDLKQWAKDAQINTDRNLRLQYLAGLAYNSYAATGILEGILKYYRFPEDQFVGSAPTIQTLRDSLSNAGRR
jgi:spermidine synthase